MATFGFFTDIHLSGKTPRHRADDYPRTMLGKLREVYREAKAMGCRFMLFGGDFFNTHRVFSYDVIGDAMDIICDAGMPTYACIGEHDLYGHSPETFPSSTLAFFIRRCPSFRIVREPMELEDGIVVHAKHEWESPDIIGGQGVSLDRTKYNVLVCHELITNQQAPFDVVHTSKFTDSPFDLVLSGDLHDGYPPHQVGKTWFFNPGSLARQKSNDGWRTPQFVVVDVEKGLDPVFHIQRLACAKPGSEVFNENAIEVINGEEFDGTTFADEMLAFEADAVDIHELIQNFGRASGVKPEVLAYLATKRADKAEGEEDERRA